MTEVAAATAAAASASAATVTTTTTTTASSGIVVQTQIHRQMGLGTGALGIPELRRIPSGYILLFEF